MQNPMLRIQSKKIIRNSNANLHQLQIPKQVQRTLPLLTFNIVNFQFRRNVEIRNTSTMTRKDVTPRSALGVPVLLLSQNPEHLDRLYTCMSTLVSRCCLYRKIRKTNAQLHQLQNLETGSANTALPELKCFGVPVSIECGNPEHHCRGGMGEAL